MFTGIVEGTGTVADMTPQGEVWRLRVDVAGPFTALPLGGSIAVDGCCLTVVISDPGRFACDLTAETLRRTRFDERLAPGVRVNLERPMRADGRFEGHLVQGHVDGVGKVVALRRAGEAADLVVEHPRELGCFLVEKGSVAVDGISLTVSALGTGTFTVAVIPYTLEVTNLGDARAGDPVNLETDVIAKYVDRLLFARGR
jgi:riboflavin synthase